MSKNSQPLSRKDLRMNAEMITEKERQQAYQEALQTLINCLQGEVLLPSDAEFEAARGVWDASANRHPALIVNCANTEDVMAAVTFAREQGIVVSVRSGGHSPAGYSTNDGGMVIDLSHMKNITVDAEQRSARLEPGLTWSEVANTLQPYGLAITSGDAGSVGVGGLLLGGGIGWMVRKHGLTIDRLRAVEMVTADGEFLRASADENAELFWGLRGGGGNFGIATAFEVDLHAAGIILGGAVFYDIAEAESVLQAYARYTAEAPDELTTQAMLMAAPPAPFIPPDMQGKPVVVIFVCYTGDLAEGARVVAPLRTLGTVVSDIIAPMPYPVMYALTEEATVRGLEQYVRSLFAQTMSDELLHTIVAASSRITSHETMIQIRILGGAMSRVAANATAFVHRDKRVMVSVFNSQPPAASRDHVANAEQIWQALQPYAEGVYVNFLANEGEQRIRDAYSPETYERLAALKKRYDPTNLFHLNQNIAPARTGLLGRRNSSALAAEQPEDQRYRKAG